MKRNKTVIRLKSLIVPNPRHWKSGLPNSALMEPRGSRIYNLWFSKHLFCPKFRYMLVEKGERHANKKS